MRGVIEGLENPHPVGHTLPAIYQDDDFTMRFTRGFDEVIAPLFLTIDNIDAYFDPYLTPEDFLEWLAGWVGLEIDETWTEARRRALIGNAVEMYRWRGTKRGIALAVETLTGIAPEVEDSGGADWSHDPGGPFPGSPAAHVTVRVRVRNESEIDVKRLAMIVKEATPANVLQTIEVVAAE